jgi:hypothetical protein
MSTANRPLLMALLIAATATTARAADGATSAWVYPGPGGRLVYKTTPAGDRIMDFSHAGYMGGGVAIPNVAVKQTVQPSGLADDTALIQTAIDAISALPEDKGFRGAVFLAPGTFNCASTITISASGVVLRGGGSGSKEGEITTINMTGKPHLAIAVRAPGGAPRGAAEPGAARTSIADAYVPSGATAFAVASAAGFAVGDTIEIRRPVTQAWVKFMRMDDLVRDGSPQTWIRTGNTTLTQRKITAISDRTITLDVPLADSFDARYLNPPGTTVAKIQPPARLAQVGIEYLHLKCPPQEINHTQAHFTALRMNGQDCWARDVVIDETMNSVAVGGTRITLERVAVNRKARHQGSSKPAEFAPNAGQVLMDRCTVTGDNIWFVATGAGQAGPIVALNCTFNGDGRAESHQRWSTGMLYDNCHAPSGGLEFRNRGEMGSGHGWSMGWGVMWNCQAKDYVVQNPPGAINWMIGCQGENTPKPRPFDKEPNLPAGTQDSPGTPVAPQSLYLTQLAERLGPQAVKNIGY